MFSLLLASVAPAAAVDTILRVAFAPNTPPFQFSADGKPVGIHVDVLSRIAQDNDFILHYRMFDTTTKCVDALNRNEVDMVLGVMPDMLVSRDVSISAPFSQSSICMVAPSSMIEGVGFRGEIKLIHVAFENGMIGFPIIPEMNKLRFTIVSSQAEAFDLMVTGRSDTMVGNKTSILFLLKRKKIEDDYTIVNNHMGSVWYCAAVRAEDRSLLQILDGALQRMRISGEYERIYQRWINEDEYLISVTRRRILRYAAMVAILALVVIIANARWSFLLKKEVAEKTDELARMNVDLQRQIVETRENSEVKDRIVNDSPNGIIVFDCDFAITLFNQSAEELTGERGAQIGRNVLEIGLLRKILDDKKDAIFERGYEVVYKDKTIEDEDGGDKVYRYDIYQLFDSDGGVRGAILSLKDITSDRRMREQAAEREKHKALNQLIAGIAHEIRNPLTSIKTFVELMPRKKDDRKFQSLMAEYVPKELNRVNNLIKNLIDYARPESSNKERIDAGDVVTSCAALIESTIRNPQIEMRADISNGLYMIADRVQLRQVLINIMLNGIESMEEKLSLETNPSRTLRMIVRAYRDSDHVYICVRDEGVGMRKEEIRKATEPFYTTKVKGTGMGLAVTKQNVEENSGTMKIESEKGEYASIVLRFDRAYEDGSGAAAVAAELL